MNSIGKPIWSKTYGNSTISSIQVLPNGDFLSCGENHISKYTADGIKTIDNKYSGVTFTKMEKTTDGNIILSGYKDAGDHTNSKDILVKSNQNCDTIWTRSFGNSRYAALWSVKQATDGGFVATGRLSGLGMWVIKTDRDGNL
jgi:hypothetical protein